MFALWLGGAGASGVKAAGADAGAAPSGASAELLREVETYRVCAKLNLPGDFRMVKDSAAAVAVALEKCQRQRFVVAGQFALDNPGTTRTRHFVDGVTAQVVDELSRWLEDVDAQRVSPMPRQRPKP